MALSKDTIDSLIVEYRDALSDEGVLDLRDKKLNDEVIGHADDMRDNKKQITSLRAILKANDVDVKAL